MTDKDIWQIMFQQLDEEPEIEDYKKIMEQMNVYIDDIIHKNSKLQ